MKKLKWVALVHVHVHVYMCILFTMIPKLNNEVMDWNLTYTSCTCTLDTKKISRIIICIIFGRIKLWWGIGKFIACGWELHVYVCCQIFIF